MTRPANSRTDRAYEDAMFDSLARKYRNWRAYNSTVTELSRLTPRELDDLGISRGEIPAVARRAVIG